MTYTKPVAEYDDAHESIQSQVKKSGNTDRSCGGQTPPSTCVAYEIDE